MWPNCFNKMKELESTRFITGLSIARDLCLREGDNLQANRMRYSLVVKDALRILNFKTTAMTERIALPVIRNNGLPYVQPPAHYLDLHSVCAPDHNGKLAPMIINTNIKTGIVDMTLANKCGCDCGCGHELCSYIRNFETIYGTMPALMPDNSTKVFNTTYRKLLMEDGSFIEEKIVPAYVYTDGAHTGTQLETQRTILCKLDIKPCGCIKDIPDNHRAIGDHCQAVDYKIEFGTGHIDRRFIDEILFKRGREFNFDENDGRIYFPNDFIPDHVVVRIFVNNKTKNIVIPFLQKEVMMAQIKSLIVTYDAKSTMADKEFWKGEVKQRLDEYMEDIYRVTLTNFYAKLLGTKYKRG